MPENYKWDWNLAFNLADQLDHMAATGDMEAEVVYRRYLHGYTHEQTAAELNIPVEMSQKIAAQGLKKIKDSAYPIPDDGKNT